MTSIPELLLPASQQVINYAKRLLHDIPVEQFARKPVHAGSMIEINHPAFQIGHLGLYPGRIGGVLELTDPGLKAPAHFSELFLIGSPCKDDLHGDIYPTKQVITEHFFSSHEALFAALKKVPDELYLKTNLDEKSKERFPILGSFILYLLTAHANTHLGQISAWRRCIGLAAV